MLRHLWTLIRKRRCEHLSSTVLTLVPEDDLAAATLAVLSIDTALCQEICDSCGALLDVW